MEIFACRAPTRVYGLLWLAFCHSMEIVCMESQPTILQLKQDHRRGIPLPEADWPTAALSHTT